MARKEAFYPIGDTNWHHVPQKFKVDMIKCIRKYAECGKETRASQNHVHTTGSTSYANIRAELEEKNKREPTELEVFKQTHKGKDGSYVKDTVTEEFVLDADAYIQSELATNPTKLM
ncbi:uncharacterized protein LOC141595283 [Silene latifolia]|uniref:uncharacterized protein LOC141595283 n=1 Tax=Silene latifolia TaxID=37657 RepID=UPI003D77846D